MTPFFGWSDSCLPFEVFCSFWLFVLTSQRFGGVLGVTPFCSISSLLPYFTFRCEAPSLPTTQLSAAYSTHTKINVTWSWYAPKNRHLHFRGWVPPITPTSSGTFTPDLGYKSHYFRSSPWDVLAVPLRQKKIATKGGVLKDPPFGGKTHTKFQSSSPNITELLQEMPRDKVESWSQLWQPHKKKYRKILKCLKDETDHVWLWSKCEATDSLRNDRKYQVNMPTSKIPQIAAPKVQSVTGFQGRLCLAKVWSSPLQSE